MMVNPYDCVVILRSPLLQLPEKFYACPNQEAFVANLSGEKFFFNISLTSAYLQLGIEPISQHSLTITAHEKLFSFQRIPYGITGAPY